MKPISYYCKAVDGWNILPYSMFTNVDPQKFPPEYEPYFASFINQKIGVQLTCGVYKTHVHVSICPVISLGNETPVDNGLDVIREFFGDLYFVRMADDPNHPRIRHFFHYFNYPFANN